MISIRQACESDLEALCSLDLIARREDERGEFIRRSIPSNTCFVAVADEEVIGYGVLNYTFYMSDERNPHLRNAPGPFYVQNGCCIMCMAPHAQAPMLMGFDDADGHCFVKQQPQTEDEIYMAIRAVRSSEVQCLRYRGHDPDILRRLVEIGEGDACDLPLPTISDPILRNYVTFTTTFANEAWDVAIALRDYILSQNSEYGQFQVTHPERKGEVVTFSYSWFEDHYYTVSIDRGEPSTDRWLVHHSPIWEVGSVGVSLMIDDWLRSDPRFTDFRWYTLDVWNQSVDDWQERPY